MIYVISVSRVRVTLQASNSSSDEVQTLNDEANIDLSDLEVSDT